MRMPRYEPSYPEGARVKIASRDVLEEFRRAWKYHHRLEPHQLVYAGQDAAVKSIGLYHGGDVIYWLDDIPGTWHECCLVPAD